VADRRRAGSRSSAARISLVLTATALVAVSACSDPDAPTSDPTVITLGVEATDTPITETAPASTAAPAAVPPSSVVATVPVDAPAMLAQSLDGVTAGFHFRTTVEVAGAEVLVAEGDRVGDGTRLTIWSSGTSVAYVITPAGSWVFPEGGEWEALDSAPATTDPLQALRSAAAVAGTSTDGVNATLVATVAASALGVPSDGTAGVQVLVSGATLQEVSYAAPVDGQTATVRSVFSPVVDATPVTAPA
jgi:hypothetical protein